MAICDACGNDYARAFRIIGHDGTRFVADSIECAAHLIAPLCGHCACRILGHGIETPVGIYCCASCARHAGEARAVDNTAAAGGDAQPALAATGAGRR